MASATNNNGKQIAVTKLGKQTSVTELVPQDNHVHMDSLAPMGTPLASKGAPVPVDRNPVPMDAVAPQPYTPAPMDLDTAHVSHFIDSISVKNLSALNRSARSRRFYRALATTTRGLHPPTLDVKQVELRESLSLHPPTLANGEKRPDQPRLAYGFKINNCESKDSWRSTTRQLRGQPTKGSRHRALPTHKQHGSHIATACAPRALHSSILRHRCYSTTQHTDAWLKRERHGHLTKCRPQ